MIESVHGVEADALSQYDAVIDVRSPAEYAEDRIPGAINLPVLSNSEREEVGTIYVQDSRFRARRVGAAYIARNVATHLETALAGRDPKFRPLLYCWRGGMRSNSMATILSQIGWRVGVLDGGYKTWRRAVVAALLENAKPSNLVLVDGPTGAAKTEIIRRMSNYGVQAIDLEELAAHRGSVFGADAARAQPSQKLFESELFDRLRRFEKSAPIIVEAESAKIGRLNLPKSVWAAMRTAPRISIRSSVAARSEYLLRAYADVVSDPALIGGALDRLRAFHAKEKIDAWMRLADEENYKGLAVALMTEHYDPLYARSGKGEERRVLGEITVSRLDDGGIDGAAANIADLLKATRI
jgi:tRNA 2-selenouridine synthase